MVTEPDPALQSWPLVRRTIVWSLAGIALLWLARVVLADLKSLLVMVLVAFFLSFAIEPAVNRLAARGWRRGSATALVMGGTVVLVGVFIAVMGTLVVDQIRSLIDDAPRYLERSVRWINDRFNTDLKADDLSRRIEQADLPNWLASRSVDISTAVLTGILNFLTIALFTFYLVADGPRLRRSICSVLRPDRQREVLRIWEVAIDKTGGYLASRVALAILSAIAHGIVFSVAGVPSAVALAVWVGLVSQFLPVVGTYLAGVLPVVIALVDSPAKALVVVVMVVVYQQVENYLFAPRITARTMAIHPALAFGSVLAGAAMLGTAGALLALPASASIQAIVSTYLTRHEVVESPLTIPSQPRRAGVRRRRSGPKAQS
jgi:predicted PurR-regulated permease PerM